MTQILDALPARYSRKLLCCYPNCSSELQMVRITNIPNWYFERVVFPYKRLLFEAVLGAVLEIYRGEEAMSSSIACERLQVVAPDLIAKRGMPVTLITGFLDSGKTTLRQC